MTMEVGEGGPLLSPSPLIDKTKLTHMECEKSMDSFRQSESR